MAQIVMALNAEDHGDRDAQEQNSTSGDREKAVADTAHGGLRFLPDHLISRWRIIDQIESP